MRLAPRNEHRDSGLLGDLPLTTMVDVVFLLLVYFMVVSSLTPREAELAAALEAQQEPTSSAADFQPQVVTVDVDDAGGFVLSLGARQTADSEELRSWLAVLPKEAGVFIEVKNRASVAAAAAALQAAKDAGFRRVTYVPAE
ncbi:MAG: biopolymer transporter ExbD [Planctomycetota bacterium]